MPLQLGGLPRTAIPDCKLACLRGSAIGAGVRPMTSWREPSTERSIGHP